ncbi:MAG: hypothetical protein KDC28_11840 [Saprospiraceae bacterium]|nr:hypothetical protein [Saprospiraceae bacterium]
MYSYDGSSIEVYLGKVSGGQVVAKWLNPRTGEITSIGKYENSGSRIFKPTGPQGDGNDWVLILESVE